MFISSKRFSLLLNLAITYLFLSIIVRLILYIYSFSFVDFSIINFFKIFTFGLFFDIGSLSYLLAPYTIYLMITPSSIIGKSFDRFLTLTFYFLFLFISIFSFLAEITFWMEYQKRFNFIAVDYLLFTYEVISNINESYPIPLLVLLIFSVITLFFYLTNENDVFKKTFIDKLRFNKRLFPVLLILIILSIYHYKVKNSDAEVFRNVIENELSKSGIYSFFESYNSNEINYNDFYLTTDILNSKHNKIREITSIGDEKKPNIILIVLESFSSNFMEHFGNKNNLSPTIDSLSKKSIFFTNLYAVGTRTVRGLEAITLSIPPTPGRSIIKRKNNDNLFNIGSVFKEKGYSNTFFYGGDGYFDNMNLFLGNNNFKIVDRRNKNRFVKQFNTERIEIEDHEVSFENSWGVCDEDLFNKLLKVTDKQYKTGVPFFNLVMTSSNHQPYTYPDHKVNIPSGTNREGAIKYADFSLKEFINKAKKKDWFNNTIFVFISDHCAYSAGRTELNIRSHHIPAMIYNLNREPEEISKLSSQIDIMPTLFGYLNWSYSSIFFGKDINKLEPENERAFISNHRRLGLLKENKFMTLGAKKKANFYNWNSDNNILTEIKIDSFFLKKTITYYQSAYELFKNNGLKNTYKP